MKNALRLYITFIPTRILPWIMFIVYPAVAILLSIASAGAYPETYIVIGIVFVPIVYVVENLLSLVMFREFESKEPVRFEYMHSSVKGMRAFATVMKADIVRRFIMIMLIFALPAMLQGILHIGETAEITWEIEGEEGIPFMSPANNILIAFVLLSIIELMGYIVKRVSSSAVMFVVIFMGYGIVMYWTMAAFDIPGKLMPAAIIVAALIYLVIALSTYKSVMKHEEGKFYDGNDIENVMRDG